MSIPWANVKDAPACSVPSSSTTSPLRPRLSSVDTCRTLLSILVSPLYVLVPVSVSVPLPACVTEPVPRIAPPISYRSASVEYQGPTVARDATGNRPSRASIAKLQCTPIDYGPQGVRIRAGQCFRTTGNRQAAAATDDATELTGSVAQQQPLRPQIDCT